MKLKIASLLLLSAIIIISCSKETLSPKPESQNIPNEENSFFKNRKVLKGREGNGKFVLSSRELPSIKLNARMLSIPEPIEEKYYLGMSYKGDQNITGDPEYIGYKIINIEDLLRDHPDLYVPLNLDKTQATTSSFASFDRYEIKTNSKRTITAGFSVNLGLFTIGSKNTFINIFSNNIVNETKRVFGELNVEVKGSAYRLLSSSNTRSLISENYLNDSFLNELYNTPRGEFIKNFGPFVLTDFYTGGRAIALYTGTDFLNTSTETIEKNMDLSINASFGFKTKKDAEGKITGDFGFANGSGDTTSGQSSITNLSLSIKSIGGDKGFQGFTVPKKIEDININLGDWLKSLNDRTKFRLIGINDGGLTPISAFLLEENAKQALEKYLSNPTGGIANMVEFVTPDIPILPTPIPGDPSGSTGRAIWQVFLLTRFGDIINISPSNMNVEIPMTGTLMNDIITSKSNFYTIAYMGAGDYFYPESASGPVINLAGIDEAAMKKFVSPKNNKTYLLYSGNGKKYAFAIYDDYVLDTYGIRSWVNSMPTVAASHADLKSYIVIGL